MKGRRRCFLILAGLWLLILPLAYVQAYDYCGHHDGSITLSVIHWNSEFWVDMFVEEARKWNRVHGILTVGRGRQAAVPVGKDGRWVVSWIGETDLNRHYGVSWSDAWAWTFVWRRGGECGRVVEADVFFNPAIPNFTPQTTVPYRVNYQTIALHEIGHVLTHKHEDRSLAVMSNGFPVSDVLYASDKVGWLRSADVRFSVVDRADIGVFPLRNTPGPKTYSTLFPGSVRAGENVTIRDFTVQNLSSGRSERDILFRLLLEHAVTGVSREIGSFSWGAFPAYGEWAGDLTMRVPPGTAAGRYRVVARYQGSDNDSSNDRAVFGQILVM